MGNILKTGLAVALLTGTALATARADEDVTAWRVFVADHAESVVRVIDLETQETLETFDLDAPARLYRSSSGETVFAVQGGADRVAAMASGIAFHDHGDHQDIEVKDPRLLDVAFAGGRPSHFVEHRGEIAIFFDGDGKAAITRERDVLDGSSEVREFDSGAPHHGAAAVFAGHVLISEPHPEDPSNLPVGIQVLTMGGEPVGELHDCPDLHGEASSGNVMAFACATGLLVVTEAGGAPAIEHLAYAETLPDGKATTLLGGRGLQYFLGNFGADRVVLIDHMDKDAFRLIELPTRRVHFAVDPIRARFAYVFTEDGALHQLDVLGGEVTGTLPLTDPYSMDGHWNDPRPRITVAGDHVVVTDPLAGQLHLIDAASFEQSGVIEVEGMPFNIVAVGGTGIVHDDHDHDHEH